MSASDDESYECQVCGDCFDSAQGRGSHFGFHSDEEKREALVTEIQRLADELDRPVTSDDMKEYGNFDRKTYQDMFGTWNDALKEAGLPINNERNIGKNTLIDALIDLYNELDRPVTTGDMEKHGTFSVWKYEDTFGSWNNALEAAGLPITKEYNIAKEVLIDALHDLHDELDRPVTKNDMKEYGTFSEEPYVRAFGSWSQALDAVGLKSAGGFVFHEELDHATRYGWEPKVARLLFNNDIDYEYEGMEIPYNDNRTYIPDFVTDNYVIEVKGRPRNSAEKARAALEYLENREYVLIGGDPALDEIPADHKYHYHDEREQILELFDTDVDRQPSASPKPIDQLT